MSASEKKYPRGLAGQIHPLKARYARRKLNDLKYELGSAAEVARMLDLHQSTVGAVLRGDKTPGQKVWEAVQSMDEVSAQKVEKEARAAGEDTEEKAKDSGGRGVKVIHGPFRVKVHVNGKDPSTIPELLHVIRALLDTSLEELDSYEENNEVSPFARGGLGVLRERLEKTREDTTL